VVQSGNAAEPYLGRRALRPQPEGHQLRAGAAEGVTRDLRARSGPVFYPAPREYFLHGCTAVDYFLSPKSSFPIGFSRSRGGPRGPRACSRRARGRPRPAAASAGSPRRRPRPRARSPGDHKGSGSVTVSEIEATTILMDQFLV
jgi:hypothetical protein